MTNKELKITYLEFECQSQLDPKDRELVEAAIKAMEGSYAPYSKFNVGAAVRLEDDEIISGANQENAAYPSGICAERTALFYAGANRPDKAVTCIAIAAGQGGKLCEEPVTPCGSCRQVMAQTQLRGGRPMAVILVGSKRIWRFEKVNDVLPFIFDSI
jgi:cytidine deaminase